jgi:AcrR family transcriptional regulator
MSPREQAPTDDPQLQAPSYAAPNGLAHPRTSHGGRQASGREHPIGHQQVVDIQRARILRAMAEVVAERGVSNVTVAHVVARSGVSRRTFYELFSDREDCFLAAFDDAIQHIAAVVVPAYAESSRWREKIRAGLTALLGLLDCQRGVGRLVFVEALGAGANALERRRRVLDQVIAAVDEGRNEAMQGDGSTPMAAEGVVGGVLAVLHSRLLACPGTAASPRSPAAKQGPRAGGPSPPPAGRGPRIEDPEGDSPVPEGRLLALAGPLMSMIVLPYLGPAVARKELTRPVPARHASPPLGSPDPLRDLDMRLTYRTVRVLMAVAELGGRGSYPSNREVGAAAGMTDQGQTSKLLSRLHRLGLIQNTGIGPSKGAPNAWKLTPKGVEVEKALAGQRTLQPLTNSPQRASGFKVMV